MPGAVWYIPGVGYHISYHISNTMVCDNTTIPHYHTTFFPAQCPIPHKYHYHIQYGNTIFEYGITTVLPHNNTTSAVAPSARARCSSPGDLWAPWGPHGAPWGGTTPMGPPQPLWGPIMGPHGGHYHNIISRYVIWYHGMSTVCDMVICGIFVVIPWANMVLPWYYHTTFDTTFRRARPPMWYVVCGMW